MLCVRCWMLDVGCWMFDVLRAPLPAFGAAAAGRSSGGSMRGPRGSFLPCLFQHFVSPGFELGAGFPFRVARTVGDFQSHLEQQARVVRSPRKVPVRFDFVGDLVVVVRGVGVDFLRAELLWLADELNARLK